MRSTDNAGAGMVFDPVAGPGVAALVDAMAPAGILFIFGALSGQATPFPLIAGMSKALTMRGYTAFEAEDDKNQSPTDPVPPLIEPIPFISIMACPFSLRRVAE